MLPGVGVSSAEVTDDNKLSVKLSNGQEVSSIFINIYTTPVLLLMGQNFHKFWRRL